MIELFVCSSQWECVKEIIGGTFVVIVFFMYSCAFCQIIGPRKSMRIEPLDRFIFYLAYVQVLLQIILNLLYSNYIVGYLMNMLGLFMEMLICSIFLLVSGTISGLYQLKCILFLMLLYLLAVMGVAIYLSLITDHDQDVIECQGTIWIVLCGNNLLITLIVLVFALLSIRRRKISPEGRATISRALGNESMLFHESRPKSQTNKIKDVVNRNTFIEDEDEQVIISQPFMRMEDQSKFLDSEDPKDRSQHQLFEDSTTIKLRGTTYTMTRPTMDPHHSRTLHTDKADLLFTKIETPSQEKVSTNGSPVEKFDLMSYEMLRKKKDLVILLICSVLSVVLSLVWELIVYLEIQNSSCYHFQHHRPIWELSIYAVLQSLSKEVILVAIYYVIYWKNRKNLRGFDYRSDIAIHERGGTISTKYGKISMIERKNRKSQTFSGSHQQLLKKRDQSTANFTMREEEEFMQKKDSDRSSSHDFEGHDLVPSPESHHRLSGSSASVAANVSAYVRTTLVKKKKPSINRKRGKERTQSFVTESP